MKNKYTIKNNVKLVLAVVIALLLCLSATIFSVGKNSNNNAVLADGAIVQTDAIAETYALDDAVTFPSEATINYNGADYTGKFMGCQSADGNIYSLTSFSCNDLGKYSAIYSFEQNGKTLLAKKEFTVNKSLFNKFNGASTMEYGELTYIPKSSPEKTHGLIVDLAEGDTISFNEPIDITKGELNELLSFYPVQIEKYWEFQSIGRLNSDRRKAEKAEIPLPDDILDCQYINVDVTDAYDPTRTVQLQMRFVTYYNSRMITGVTVCTQGIAGLDPNSGGVSGSWTTGYEQIEINGSNYFIWGESSLNGQPQRGSELQGLTGSWRKLNQLDVDEYIATLDPEAPDYEELVAQKQAQLADDAVVNGATIYDLSWRIESNEGSNLVYFGNTNGGVTSDRLVNDISSTNITKKESAFEGFTTGEVYITISASEYINPSTKLEIYSIGDKKGEDLQSSICIDSRAPHITADMVNAEKDTYVGLVNQAISIPSVTSLDINQAKKASTLVYYNYGTTRQSLVNVRNNRFIPDAVGEYSIVYSATDAFGNNAKKVIKVNVINNFKNPLGINMTSKPVSACNLGDAVAVPAYDGVNYNGEVTTKITVKAPDGTSAEVKNNKFTAAQIGTYKVTYTLQDELYTYVNTYDVTVSSSDAYFFTETPTSKNYYLKNATYKLDDFHVYYQEDGKVVSKLCDVYVRYDKTGDFVKSETGYDVKIAGNNFVEFKYGFTKPDSTVIYSETFGLMNQEVANIVDVNYLGKEYVIYKLYIEDNGETSQTEVARLTQAQYEEIYLVEYEQYVTNYNADTAAGDPAYQAKYEQWVDTIASESSTFNIGRYFIGDASVVTAGSGQRITTNAEFGNSTIEFANPFLFSNLQLKFSIPINCDNFERINFYYKDVNDASKVIKISMMYKYFHTLISVNDGTEFDVSQTYKDDEGKTLFKNDGERTIRYQASAGRLMVVAGKTKYINIVDEIPDLCYFSVEFVGITGTAAIDISNINMQSMSADTDNGNPTIQVQQSNGNQNYGTKVAIYDAIVGDVLSPVSLKDVKVTVTDQVSKKAVKDIDGVELNGVSADKIYYIEVTSERYLVEYSGLTDGYDKPGKVSYNIYTVDNEKPVVTFNDGSDSETVVKAKVNTEVAIKEFTVTDNKSGPEDIKTSVIIVNEYGMWEEQVVDMKYTFTRTGNFTIKVISQDANGNTTTASYKIVIE